MRALLFLAVAAVGLGDLTSALSTNPSPSSRLERQKQTTTRRGFVAAAVILLPATIAATSANAFDGSGSSSYAGRTPLQRAEKAKGYQARIIEDMKDFNRLGVAINNGETEGEAWVGFFVPYQRREPDPVGRTYAALSDLIGVEKTGGAALLLSNTFAKPNKPSTNIPQYKKYDALLQSFDPIQKAGKAGDAKKAKAAYAKAATALSEYLELVDLPGSLSDPIYE